MPITVKITDPKTLELLRQYKQYVAQKDGVSGSINQLVEGLMIGCLDEHRRFREWSQQRKVAA